MDGLRRDKTTRSSEANTNIGNNWLGELVHEEYWQIAEQLDPDLQLGYANSGPMGARFTSGFRHSREGSIAA